MIITGVPPVLSKRLTASLQTRIAARQLSAVDLKEKGHEGEI